MAEDGKMRVLIADDEPFYLEWLADYLESKDIIVDYATTVDEAVNRLRSHSYRAMVVDLNIPLMRDPGEYASNDTEAYGPFPGLYIANVARNSGYRTKQLIVYSVHSSPEIEEAVGKLYCTYLTKGHPADLKNEIDDVLSFDPSSEPKKPKKAK